MKKVTLILLFVLALLNSSTEAKPPKTKVEKLTPEQQKAFEKYQELAKIESELKYQQGKIIIGDNLAVLNLSDKYQFLDGTQAERVLTKLWGNPPSKGSEMPLGMIVSKDIDLLGEESWAVIITFSDDGHVADDDAEGANYNELLAEMQKETQESNAERIKNGYPSINLVGWAEQPSYDKTTHKIYWAKNFKFGDSEENTLNYDVRILGRTGYLSMNAISPLASLPSVKTSMNELLPMADFQEGKRYGDFDSTADKVAEYGVISLIVGGVAAKTGLLKIIGLALLKFSKLIIVGVIALGGFLSRLLFGKKNE